MGTTRKADPKFERQMPNRAQDHAAQARGLA
jgi:hypothetical protein